MNIQIPWLFPFLLLSLTNSIHHCCNGVLLEHPDPNDFSPFTKSRHYAEKDGELDVKADQRCQCGKELVNDMALVYFEFDRKLSVDDYLIERYLVSAKALASGGYSKRLFLYPILLFDEFCAMAMPRDIDNDDHFVRIVKQILDGLNELHEKDYIYMDLKPSNMLVMPYPAIRSSGERRIDEVYLKLIDMAGYLKIPKAKGVNVNYVEISKLSHPFAIRTPEFEAPEVYNTKHPRALIKISQAYDIWSVGVSLLYLLANSHVFRRHLVIESKREEIYREFKMPDGQLEKMDENSKHKMLLQILARNVIAKGQGDEHPLIKQIVHDLKVAFPTTMAIVWICLKEQPEDRPTAKQLLALPELQGIDLNGIYDENKPKGLAADASSSPSVRSFGKSHSPAGTGTGKLTKAHISVP